MAVLGNLGNTEGNTLHISVDPQYGSKVQKWSEKHLDYSEFHIFWLCAFKVLRDPRVAL